MSLHKILIQVKKKTDQKKKGGLKIEVFTS